ncbi:MAG: hypothetical protein NZ576_06585 [Bacteroidia bacterium]|nr:hypothetical protein [Bacteroidia bacterium]
MAQKIPQGINYQAIVRDASGAILANRPVTVRLSILAGSELGPIEYAEVHTTTSNKVGLINLVVGSGSAIAGSFQNITWANTPKYIKVELALEGNNFILLGTNQLLTVPYAMVADTVLKGGGSNIQTVFPLQGTGRLNDPIRLMPGNQGGQVLYWNGNNWQLGALSGDNWGNQSAATIFPIIGNGTSTAPLQLAPGSAPGQVLVWNGSSWMNASPPGDNWGNQTVVTNSTLGGSGTATAPLEIAQQGATLGQVLKWNGTSWVPGNDEIAFSGTLQTSPRISGNGTAGSPLDLASQGASVGQVLKWNGSAWVPGQDQGATYTASFPIVINNNILQLAPGLAPGHVLSWNGLQWVSTLPQGDNWGNQTVVTDFTLQGDGTPQNRLRLASQGASVGQVLKWNGSAWVPGIDNTVSLAAQSPLMLNGNTISLINGTAPNQILKWVNNQWILAPEPSISLTAGNGITINGNTISSNLWIQAGNDIFRPSGRVGVGTNMPETYFHVAANSNPLQAQMKLKEVDNDFARINFENTTSNFYWAISGRPESSNTQGRLNFFYSGNNEDLMSLAHYGTVGIGTVDPEADSRLHVVAEKKYAALFMTNLPNPSATVINAVYDGQAAVDAVGVAGEAEPAWGKGFGAQFYGGNTGVLGAVDAGSFNGGYATIGVYGEASDAPTEARVGTRIGVYGYGKGGEFSVGVYGGHDGSGRRNLAGLFEGDVQVRGGLAKAFGSFMIDHPLYPRHKYLLHSFVESPDMMNIYNGNVISDSLGVAWVELPAYFEALNKDFRYQLTVIGGPYTAYVAQEISSNRFMIKTSAPNVKVSWQVTGIRKDPVAEKYRIQPEIDKQGSEVGKYLHPEVYNQPAELGMQTLFRRSNLPSKNFPKRPKLQLENSSLSKN